MLRADNLHLYNAEIFRFETDGNTSLSTTDNTSDTTKTPVQHQCNISGTPVKIQAGNISDNISDNISVTPMATSLQKHHW